MSQYTKEVLKMVVAKICQTIGWHSIQTAPLEIMVDILRRYIYQLATFIRSYSEQYGYTQPTLDTMSLAFREMHINLIDLEEYVTYVDSSPAIEVPKYPIFNESHLNFLKPGSNEVVTRPVHIHEHLPPMLSKIDESEPSNILNQIDDAQLFSNVDPGYVFKRPADISPVDTPNKKARWCTEEEGRPTREISSVMMTTSGFLSPAREGRLPEPRTPLQTIEHSLSAMNPQQLSPNIDLRHGRRTLNRIRDGKKDDKRKDKTNKELFKSSTDDMNSKKITLMKDVMKNKISKGTSAYIQMNIPSSSGTIKNNLNSSFSLMKNSKAQQKSNKNDKTSASIPLTIQKPTVDTKIIEGKLSSEPDKLKQDILKKISRMKDDKVEKIEKPKKEGAISPIEILESRESSPDLIIDEPEMKYMDQSKSLTHKISNSHSKCIDSVEKPNKPFNTVINKSFELKSLNLEKDFIYDDDISPPGTPSIPKTPEMVSNSPPLKIEKEIKKKRKEKNKIKNKTKVTKHDGNSRHYKSEIEITEILERPKTPEDPVSITKEEPVVPPPPTDAALFPFFTPFSSSPGLIPVGMPFFPKIPIATPPNISNFGQSTHLSPTVPILPFPSIIKTNEEPLEKSTIVTQEQSLKIEKPNFDVTVAKEKHKKDKKDKTKKKNKKDKTKNKSEKKKTKEEKKDKDKTKKDKKDKKKEKEKEQESSVPKILLKIGSPRPDTPEPQMIARKIMIKPMVKMNEDLKPTSDNSENLEKHEPPPELARFSALITGPPKLKISKECPANKEEGPQNMGIPIPKHNGSPVTRRVNPSFSKGPGSTPNGVKDVHDKVNRLKQQSSVDNNGAKIWICPACGGQDDGTPMIGCDDCDAWYHWVCVGIQIPPDECEDWYCRTCILKKQETLQIDKKKKRKKKERKEY